MAPYRAVRITRAGWEEALGHAVLSTGEVRGAPVVRRKIQHRETGYRRPPTQRLEDIELALEIVIDVGLRNAEFLRDQLHGRAGVATFVEQPNRHVQDLLPLLVQQRCLCRRMRGRVLPLSATPTAFSRRRHGLTLSHPFPLFY